MTLKTDLIAFARAQGAALVGVAGVDRFSGAPRGHRPIDIMPEARSVVSVAIRLPSRLVDWEGLLAKSEVMPNNDVRWEVESAHWYGRVGYEAMNIKLEGLGLSLSLYLEERGFVSLSFPATYAHHADIMKKIPGYFAPFSHRHAAVLAGLGEFGFNNLLVTPQYGPRVRLMSVLTSAQLEPDPLLDTPVCLGESCLKCVEACGVPAKNLHAITPVARRDDGVFINMPSKVDKPACFTKYDGTARCWGKCIAACPVGS